MRRRLVRMLARAEKPAAWGMMVGGLVIFVGVLSGFIATGEAKWATLLVSLDVFVSGFSAVQDAEEELGS